MKWRLGVATGCWLTLWALQRVGLCAAAKTRPLLADQLTVRARSATIADHLRQLRACLRGEDAKPKVVLHAFDWTWPEALGAADELLKDGPPAAAVVTVGTPPPAVANFRLKSGGLYVVVLPKSVKTAEGFCESLARLHLKDPYALYVGVQVGAVSLNRAQTLADSLYMGCSSVRIDKVSPLAMRFAMLMTIRWQATDIVIWNFLRYIRGVELRPGKITSYRTTVNLLPQRTSVDTLCHPQVGLNSIDDHKKWVWKWRMLFLDYSINQLLYNAWQSKEGNQVHDGPDTLMKNTIIETVGKWFSFGDRDITTGDGNKTSKGPFKRLHDRTLHTFIMRYPYDLDLLDVVEYTLPVAQDDMCLVVRKAERVPITLVLVLPYQLHTWVCVGLTLVLIALLWPLVAPGDLTAKRRTTQLLAERFGRAFTDTFGTFITGGTYRNVISQPEKIFLGFFLVFNIIMINAYTGQIISFLTTPKYYPDINDLNEASKKIKRIYATEYITELIPNEYLSGTLRSLKDKFSILKRYNETGFLIEVDELLKSLERVATKPKEGMALAETSIDYFSLEPRNMDGDQKSLHLVPQCLLSPIFRAVAVVKGDGFYDVLNLFIGAMVEGGFFIHWNALQRNHMFANGVLLYPAGDGADVPEKLTLDQLVAPFLLLGFGLTLAGALLAVQMAQWRLASAPKKEPRPRPCPPPERVGAAGAVGAARGRLHLVRRRRQTVESP